MQALCDAYYEFWGIFPTVFFRVAMISFVLLVLFVWYFLWYDKKSQPTYISYKKNHFHEDFKFVCEFCGAVVSSTDEKCPNCAGTFGKNKEYQSKKRAMYQKYLRYLQNQEEAIQKEVDHIKRTMKAVKRYKFIWHKALNFDIGEPPIYKPAIDYEFTCEYCDNKLRGRSTDENGCNNCGASYKENLELLVREEEDRVEKRHYDQYMELKDLEWEQNLKNERRDAYVSEKYKVPINFMEKNGKKLAVAYIILLGLISVGITLLMMEFR